MKTLRKFALLLLALAVLVSLCACGEADTKAKGSTTASTTEEPTTTAMPVSEGILGTWRYDIDIAEYLITYLAEAFESDALEVQEPLNCPILFTFNAESTYRMELDTESLYTNITGFIKNLIPDLCEVFYQQAEAEGVTREQLDAAIEESYGMSLEEYIEAAFSEINIDDVMAGDSEQSNEGTYRIDGNRLYIVENGKEPDENAYLAFSLDGDELAITEFSNSEEILFQFEESITLPLVFTRIK